MDSRKKMKNAFIDWVVPALSDKGFRGGFPNYRRYQSTHIEILSFQFSLFGSAFRIKIAKYPIDGLEYRNGKKLRSDRVTANHCPKNYSLGTSKGDFTHWFKFNPCDYEFEDKHEFSFLTMYEDTLLKYKKIADDIINYIDYQAEPWWRESEEWWHNEYPIYNQLFFDIQQQC